MHPITNYCAKVRKNHFSAVSHPASAILLQVPAEWVG